MDPCFLVLLILLKLLILRQDDILKVEHRSSRVNIVLKTQMRSNEETNFFRKRTEEHRMSQLELQVKEASNKKVNKKFSFY